MNHITFGVYSYYYPLDLNVVNRIYFGITNRVYTMLYIQMGVFI